MAGELHLHKVNLWASGENTMWNTSLWQIHRDRKLISCLKPEDGAWECDKWMYWVWISLRNGCYTDLEDVRSPSTAFLKVLLHFGCLNTWVAVGDHYLGEPRAFGKWGLAGEVSLHDQPGVYNLTWLPAPLPLDPPKCEEANSLFPGQPRAHSLA